ncbi:MAG: aminodeoxychorismate/anthranilate synthase component II [Ruminococcus sp.]|nr:aminodeoxychorismate/anthranilate synthase component II [Ruminococcus sp.]
MILLIDNYDSFSYNLYQLIGEICPDIKVIRNDEMTVEEIEKLAPERIIISPGPGRPEDAGIIIEAAKTVCQKIPTLGVCLGHQAICAAYGAEITYAKKLMHGKQSTIKFSGNSPIFRGIDENAPVARYHSLAANPETVPECFEVTAIADDGEIMAVQHREYPIFGVQFHPESIMTPDGKIMLANFINMNGDGLND